MSSGVLDKNPDDDLLSHSLGCTTIGAATFHFRVRDGIGWFHSANFIRETVGASLVSSFWVVCRYLHSIQERAYGACLAFGLVT